MNKSKLLSSALALALGAASLLAFAPSKAVKAEEAKQELTVWCWDPAFNIYAMKEAEKIFQKTHPDFKLNVQETPWPDVQSKLNTSAMSQSLDTLPDILLMQDNAFQKNVLSFPDVFEDLTNSGVDFSQFSAAKTNYSVVDGKNYGVPFDNGTAIAAYRTDILEEAGLKIEDLTGITWKEFIEKGKVVLEKTKHPLLSMTSDNDLPLMMMRSAGVNLFDKDGKPHIADSDILKEVILLQKALVDSKVMQITNNWDQYVGSFNSGDVAGVINGCWILASIQSAADQSGKWAVTDLPKLEGENATNFSNNGGSSWAVIKGKGNEKLAAEFLGATFAGSKELYETILPTSGALSTWLPMADNETYAQPQEFFNGQPVYKLLTEYASKVPVSSTGVYYYEARDAIATVVQNVINGADVESELKAAQEQVEHMMNN